MQDANSAELYARAVSVMPGGVNSPVRAMGSIGRDPLFIERAEGCELIDVDGNRYIDWISSWGPLIAGHAHPEVVAAVAAAAERGTSYGAATAGEVELAEEVKRMTAYARAVSWRASAPRGEAPISTCGCVLVAAASETQ